MTEQILHLDIDAFYPSVEVLDAPVLSGKPVIVGGLGSRGVVASASYEARTYGVHSALPMAVARRRCPNGVFLRPRFGRYRELSQRVFAIYREWTERIEPLSLDEAYLDVSHFSEPGVEIARRIKRQVRERTGLTVSAGVAPNKFLAKLASDHDKPDGLTHIRAAEAEAFLKPLPVERLWGVGPATAARLRAAGYETIGDVAAAGVRALRPIVGSHADRLVRFAHGDDDRPVQPPGRPKSISSEVTFEQDIHTWREAAPHVRRFAARIEAALDRHDLLARTVTLKVRFHDFRTLTRSTTPGGLVRSESELRAAARELARRIDIPIGEGVRLVGLGVSNLVPRAEALRAGGGDEGQLELFSGKQ